MRILLLTSLFGISLARAEDSTNPRLGALRAQYDRKVTEASDAFDEFNTRYFNHLEKLRLAAQAEGDLDLAVAVRAVQKAFRERGDDFSESSHLPALAKLQKIYVMQYPKVAAERRAKLIPIRGAYREQLDALIKELTKDASIDLAVKVKNELTALDQVIKTAAKEGRLGRVTGRYVRVELRKDEALSLAEVEVFSGDKNVALQGIATQKSTGDGGDAKRGNDGNTSGKWTDGSTTHTETEEDPWWELDLLKDRKLTRIVVWNRLEYPERLDGFQISILDADRKAVWQKKITKAPLGSVEIELVP